MNTINSIIHSIFINLYCLKYINLFIVVTLFYSCLSIVPNQQPISTTFYFSNIKDDVIPYQNNIPVPSFEKQKYRSLLDLNSAAGISKWKRKRFNANHDLSLSFRSPDIINDLIDEVDKTHKIITMNYNDIEWSDLYNNIPGDENTPLGSTGVQPESYYNGVWYRCQFDVPQQDSSKLYQLKFYSVNYICDVWLNGIYLGYHEGGYSPFAFDISKSVLKGEKNILVIRVDNPDLNTSRQCIQRYYYDRNDVIPANKITDWFNYTGIIHDVLIEISDPISVERADVLTSNITTSNDKAIINYKIIITNNNSENRNIIVNAEIYKAALNESNIQSEYSSDITGNLIVSKKLDEINIYGNNISIITSDVALNINEMRDLWYPAKIWNDGNNHYSNLYVLKVTLTDKVSARITDVFFTEFGIRKINTKDGKVFINNKPIFLTGINLHEQHPYYGRSIPISQTYSDIKMLKDKLNVNWIRTAHYPHNLYTYLITDRLGICVMEEIPVWQFAQSPSQDSLNPLAFQNDVKKLHHQMFREMVFRDFNRPSIIFWSISNENGITEKDNMENDKYIKFIKNDIIINKYNDYRLIGSNSFISNDSLYKLYDFNSSSVYILDTNYSSNVAIGINTLQYINNIIKGKPYLIAEFGTSGHPHSIDIFKSNFDSFKDYLILNKNGSYNPCGFITGIAYWDAFDIFVSYADWNNCKPALNAYGVFDMFRNPKQELQSAIYSKYKPYLFNGGIIEDYHEESCK